MRRLLAISGKDLRLLWRDRGALFWTLGFPLLIALLHAVILEASQAQQLRPVTVVLVTGGGDGSHAAGPEAPLPPRLRELSAVRWERGSLAEARERVRLAQALAYLELPAGQGAMGKPAGRGAAGTPAGWSGMGKPAGRGAMGTPVLGVDPSRAAEGALLQAILGEALAAPAMRPSVPLEIVPVERSGAGRRNLAFAPALVWGLMGCAAVFAAAIVAERRGATLLRLRSTPLRMRELLGGKVLACLLASLAVSVMLLVIGVVGLGVRVPDAGLLALALVSAAACFSGLSLLLGQLGRSEQAVAGAGWATLLVMAMLGGAMVPMGLLPGWLQQVGQWSPVHWGILALEGALWRDFDLVQLLRPCAVLVGVGLLAFSIGARLLLRVRE